MSDESTADRDDVEAGGMAALNVRYIETLQEQAGLRRRAHETDEWPPFDLDHVASVVAEHATEFEDHLVVLVANDFGQPQAYVPEDADAEAVLTALLGELHRERGKWNGDDERLRAVRADLFERCPGLHKGLAALVSDGGEVTYDLGRGNAETSNFVTIRQVAGLVDWLTNSYQAEALRTTY